LKHSAEKRDLLFVTINAKIFFHENECLCRSNFQNGAMLACMQAPLHILRPIVPSTLPLCIGWYLWEADEDAAAKRIQCVLSPFAKAEYCRLAEIK
jgi:hypothetical protein